MIQYVPVRATYWCLHVLYVLNVSRLDSIALVLRSTVHSSTVLFGYCRNVFAFCIIQPARYCLTVCSNAEEADSSFRDPISVLISGRNFVSLSIKWPCGPVPIGRMEELGGIDPRFVLRCFQGWNAGIYEPRRRRVVIRKLGNYRLQ